MDYMSEVKAALSKDLISESAVLNIEKWLNGELYKPFRTELTKLIEDKNWEELNEGFYQVLPFGTGGRRGKVGIGPNRLNMASIAESAQGVANKLKKEISKRKAKVVVAYDTRMTSPEFTEKTACVLAGNDIEVYLFSGPRPTPQLSFSIRMLGCDAGIVISASHNPPQDNGFKAYWADGGQVVPPRDAELIEEVKNVDKVNEISFEEAYGKGLIHRLDEVADLAFQNSVMAQGLSDQRDVRIVYSPLHGTGIQSIWPVLKRSGFTDLHLVENQKDMDGRFPNVPKHQPNPEVTTGLDAAIKLAKAIDADLVMASDPDADRMASAVKSRENGEYTLLSGNQCAAMMMEYIANKMSKAGTLKPTHRVYTTLVSSPLMPSIARQYGLTVKDDLLVGFKWVAEQIAKQDNPDDFLFGSEESIGFMKGPDTRDKDGSVAALLMAEIAAEQKAKGATVLDFLDEIYLKYGYFCEMGTAVFLEGLSGQERMERIMASLRNDPPAEVAGHKVVAIADRLLGVEKNIDNGKSIEIEGPKANVLVFFLRDDKKSWIAIRPSGTEPKIKFYFSLYARAEDNLEELKKNQKKELEKLVEALKSVAMAIE